MQDICDEVSAIWVLLLCVQLQLFGFLLLCVQLQLFGFLASVCPTSAIETYEGALVWGNGTNMQTEYLLSPSVRWKNNIVPATT